MPDPVEYTLDRVVTAVLIVLLQSFLVESVAFNRRIPPRISLSLLQLDIPLGWSMVKSQSWCEPLRATIQIIPHDTVSYPLTVKKSTGPCK